jgi:hypothetical protein
MGLCVSQAWAVILVDSLQPWRTDCQRRRYARTLAIFLAQVTISNKVRFEDDIVESYTGLKRMGPDIGPHLARKRDRILLWVTQFHRSLTWVATTPTPKTIFIDGWNACAPQQGQGRCGSAMLMDTSGDIPLPCWQIKTGYFCLKYPLCTFPCSIS